ncbi:MAG: phosphoesterase, partial [Ignisphaera sp.]
MVKWVLFIHGDSDGVASGALAKAFLVNQGYDVDVVFTHPVGLLEDLKMFVGNSIGVFIADIALNELQREEILSVLNDLAKDRRVIYIDHHPVPDDIPKP